MANSILNKLTFPRVRTYTAADIPSPPLTLISNVPCLIIGEERDQDLRRPIVLFFHGNSSDLGTVWRGMWGLGQMLGACVYAMEYRGYGIATGNPTPNNIVTDGRRVLSQLYRRYGRPIHLIGLSIGAAVAASVAGHDPDKVASLTLLAPFSSLRDMAERLVGSTIADIMVPESNVFNTRRWLKGLPKHIPVLIVHGDKDEVIPVEQSIRMRKEIGSRIKLFIISTGVHEVRFTEPVVAQIRAQLSHST